MIKSYLLTTQQRDTFATKILKYEIILYPRLRYTIM